MLCAEVFEGYTSAFAWVKRAYERPICAEFVRPKRSWRDGRMDGRWRMKHERVRAFLPASANMCALTHPPTFTSAQLSPAGSKGSFTKTPPSRLCFPKYLWHTLTLTHTHKHTEWGSMWRFITQQCRQCAVAATVHSLPRRLLRPCPSLEDAGIGFSLSNRNKPALRATGWVIAKVWVRNTGLASR